MGFVTLAFKFVTFRYVLGILTSIGHWPSIHFEKPFSWIGKWGLTYLEKHFQKIQVGGWAVWRVNQHLTSLCYFGLLWVYDLWDLSQKIGPFQWKLSNSARPWVYMWSPRSPLATSGIPLAPYEVNGEIDQTNNRMNNINIGSRFFGISPKKKKQFFYASPYEMRIWKYDLPSSQPIHSQG